MKLEMTPIDSSPFSHSASRKVLIAEWSDIGRIQLQKLFDDAADLGIALRNPQTGRVTRWSLREELRDNDGDLIALILEPEDLDLQGYEMHILND